MLTATGIEVHYGDHLALRGVDFTARPGELSAIVGPNGSGKTSLLGAITATVPYRGRVTLNGCDIAGQRPWELAAQRAVLPQAARLAFPFTVLEVVRLGLQAGTSGAQDEVPRQALSRVGMTGHAGRSFQELSGGEAQRVMLARVLAQVWQPVADGVPRWLLLDEPVASLDIAHQLQVMDLARDFARAGGGVVAVMHDLNLTALYADAMTILSHGRCLASGRPADVMTDATLSDAYGCALRVSVPPSEAIPYVLPQAAGGR